MGPDPIKKLPHFKRGSFCLCLIYLVYLFSGVLPGLICFSAGIVEFVVEDFVVIDFIA